MHFFVFVFPSCWRFTESFDPEANDEKSKYRFSNIDRKFTHNMINGIDYNRKHLMDAGLSLCAQHGLSFLFVSCLLFFFTEAHRESLNPEANDEKSKYKTLHF